ncbi:hypothetical protein XELAEV_18034277mg [Xenopus laevis]|uniref:Shootin-1 n=1 Tax=Xenopus laevis TaxID=8355 RepID=A0A974HAY6_XENLA|nr:hypothetical protein XELAEV_18034277mg [Xenopus laevis]
MALGVLGAENKKAENVGDLKRQAVEEMMDRIKRGVPLRPVNSASRIKSKPQVPKASNTAVLELKGILETLSTSVGGNRKPKDIANPSNESELERILRRRKATAEQDASSPAGALTSLESKSMPILGTASSPSLREAEVKSLCQSNVAEGHLLFQGKKESPKVSSQSAEALSNAARQAKVEGPGTPLDLGLQSAEKADPLQRLPAENGSPANSSNC